MSFENKIDRIIDQFKRDFTANNFSKWLPYIISKLWPKNVFLCEGLDEIEMYDLRNQLNHDGKEIAAYINNINKMLLYIKTHEIENCNIITLDSGHISTIKLSVKYNKKTNNIDKIYSLFLDPITTSLKTVTIFKKFLEKILEPKKIKLFVNNMTIQNSDKGCGTFALYFIDKLKKYDLFKLFSSYNNKKLKNNLNTIYDYPEEIRPIILYVAQSREYLRKLLTTEEITKFESEKKINQVFIYRHRNNLLFLKVTHKKNKKQNKKIKVLQNVTINEQNTFFCKKILEHLKKDLKKPNEFFEKSKFGGKPYLRRKKPIHSNSMKI